jgi:hypothetical protein
MIANLAFIARVDDQGVVRRPMPGDALGSALRDVYVEPSAMPEEMMRLLRALDRPLRGH